MIYNSKNNNYNNLFIKAIKSKIIIMIYNNNNSNDNNLFNQVFKSKLIIIIKS